ncbi:MAG: type I-B CRISPR-associated endonuclease Cas1b [candidate division WOR-3 bacterium]
MAKSYYILKSGTLKRENNTIVIESEGEKKFIPIEDVKDIFIFGEITLNTKLLNFLSKNEIVLHIFNYYGYYSGSFFPRERYVSGRLLVAQAEHYLNIQERLFLAKKFIEGSIYNIIRNLRDIKSEKLNKVLEISKELEFANTIENIMNVEGRIREIYYNEYFEIEKRTRKPPLDPINALISFGNSLLYSTIISEIYQTQLNPTISYLHEPSERRFSLALDLSEIFKPIIIDPIIRKLINLNMLKDEDFLEELNYCYLSDEGKRKFLKEYDAKLNSTIKHRKLNRNVSYRMLIRLECYKLIKHMLNDEIYEPLKAWW